jgi:multicomponent Na+:H+ antiporter subunit C
LTRGAPAIVPPGLPQPIDGVANALPQALVLTAIVIGFGLIAFAFALTLRAGEELGTVDTDAMRSAEPAGDAEPASDAAIAKAG